MCARRKFAFIFLHSRLDSAFPPSDAGCTDVQYFIRMDPFSPSDMSVNLYENRFVERLQFVVGDAEVGQEFSIPRKARRLDYVCRFEEPPDVFGALREHCAHRTVLFEHESQPLAGHSVASAWFGMAWLLWQRVRPPKRHRRSSNELPDSTSRPPLAIVVADDAGSALSGSVPSLRGLRIPGLWATSDLDEGGLIVIDTSRVSPADGLAWWSWLGRAASDAAQAARLLALLGDASLPIAQRNSIQEAIMNGQLAASPMEQETVAERIRREAREAGRVEGERDGRIAGEREGRLAGERDGRAEGIREAMLELVQALAPDRIREFEAISDPHLLQRAALALVRQ
jgi:hypothetical protein